MSGGDETGRTSHPSDFEPLMRVPEVARLLNVGVSTIYRLVETHQLPCVRLGSAIRFRRSTLEKMIEAQEAGRGAETR
jgi:excisionase family DNA binding protein